MSIRSIVCVCVVWILGMSAGCVHKTVNKVAVFERSGDREVAVVRAPRSGMYRVQFIADEKYVKTPLYASDRWVMKGDPLGFREDDGGQLIAIAGDDEVSLAGAPAQATHVMWYHKSKRPTQFAKSMSATLEATAKLAAIGALGATVGIVTYYEWPAIVAAMLGVKDSDHCDNTYASVPPVRHGKPKSKRR